MESGGMYDLHNRRNHLFFSSLFLFHACFTFFITISTTSNASLFAFNLLVWLYFPLKYLHPIQACPKWSHYLLIMLTPHDSGSTLISAEVEMEKLQASERSISIMHKTSEIPSLHNDDDQNSEFSIPVTPSKLHRFDIHNSWFNLAFSNRVN